MYGEKDALKIRCYESKNLIIHKLQIIVVDMDSSNLFQDEVSLKLEAPLEL